MWGTAVADLLVTAIGMGHTSAAQQLLLIEPRANSDHEDWLLSPAHLAASSREGAAVLKLLLEMAPGLVHSTRAYEDDEFGNRMFDWTLLHGAASSGNVEVMRLLLHLAPELATAPTDEGILPLHAAAYTGTPATVQLLLDAAPETAAAEGDDGWLPARLAASAGKAGNLRALLGAGAPGLDVPTAGGQLLLHLAATDPESVALLLAAHPAAAQVPDSGGRLPLRYGAHSSSEAAVSQLLAAHPEAAGVADRFNRLPLHHAAESGSAPAVRLLLAAYPAAALVLDILGRTPLHQAAESGSAPAVRLLLAAHPAAALVQYRQGCTPLQGTLLRSHCETACVLLPSSGMSAAQLLDRFAALPNYQRQRLAPLYVALAAHLPLTPQQWQRLPTPCAGLGSTLPAVLARSEAEAALLVAHLPPVDAERLRTAALSLHRLQRRLQLDVPAHLVGRVLALVLAD